MLLHPQSASVASENMQTGRIIIVWCRAPKFQFVRKSMLRMSTNGAAFKRQGLHDDSASSCNSESLGSLLSVYELPHPLQRQSRLSSDLSPTSTFAPQLTQVTRCRAYFSPHIWLQVSSSTVSIADGSSAAWRGRPRVPWEATDTPSRRRRGDRRAEVVCVSEEQSVQQAIVTGHIAQRHPA